MSGAEVALARLVALKDGPRDSLYRERKPRAWADARTIVAALTVCPLCDGTDRDLHPMVGGEVEMCLSGWHTPRQYPSGRLIQARA